jgi:single-strand DNA-binding protein
MNKVILAGRLTKDIEMRYTQTGKAIARFILSVNRRVSKDKEKQQADFIPIIVWNKLAEVCSKYLTKGSQILVEGHLQIRDYVAQDGKKHYIAEVIAQELEFMGSKVATGNEQLQNQEQNISQEEITKDNAPDEEIPF